MQNNFIIIDNIYQSQRTEVYRAIRKTDGLHVVLKIRSRFVATESKSNLQNEYQLGKTLEGKHSVRHLALEHTSQTSILVLQDDKMSSLKSKIPEKGFDFLGFITLATEITSAIQEIHEYNIIHKNINPANIIVNSSLDRVHPT